MRSKNIGYRYLSKTSHRKTEGKIVSYTLDTDIIWDQKLSTGYPVPTSALFSVDYTSEPHMHVRKTYYKYFFLHFAIAQTGSEVFLCYRTY
jgi:hypothetical protein